MTKLLKLLRVAWHKLDEYFPLKKTNYFVHRLFNDNVLMLEIHTDLDFETALNRIENCEDDWWLDNLTIEE